MAQLQVEHRKSNRYKKNSIRNQIKEVYSQKAFFLVNFNTKA